MKLLLRFAFFVVAMFSLTDGFGQWNSEAAYRTKYSAGGAGDSQYCGIYEYVSTDNAQYTLGVVQSSNDEGVFIAYNLTRRSNTWYAGRKKATLKKTSSTAFVVDWIMGDGRTTERALASWDNGTFEIAGLSSSAWLMKTWPSEEEAKKLDKNEESDSWAGNGSGILFNSMGFVLTNQHVVDGASSVSVVIGNAGQQVEYEAGVVGVDSDIDLALLKITDVAFGGVDAPPFSFQTRASVGEEIFALGYPMALSGLGAEMKYTNGSVSANSGFNGDMKTMQISVPIQGGNSGGPLFNAQGELIGITNAKIRSDVADNVSYAIKSIFVEAFLGSMPYEVSLPNGSVETENRVDVIDALRPYTCLVLVK
jgi:S1-C subfamily serine protease